MKFYAHEQVIRERQFHCSTIFQPDDMSESSSNKKKQTNPNPAAPAEQEKLLTSSEVFKRPGTNGFLVKLIVVIVAGIVLYQVSKPAYRVYRQFRINGLTTESAELLRSGDIEGASILARRAMQMDPRNAKANAGMARVTTAFGDGTSLLFWNNAVELDKNNSQYKLEFAKCAVRFASFPLARYQLESIRETHQDDPDWLLAATGAAIGLQDFSRASSYLDALVRLEPDNPEIQLNRASLNILSTDKTKRLEGKETLEKILDSDQKIYHTQALRSLALYYSRIDSNPDVSIELRERLESMGALSWDERISLFELKETIDPEGASQWMRQWEEEALETLVNWENSSEPLDQQTLQKGVGLYSLIVWRLGRSETEEALKLMDARKINQLDPALYPRLYSRLYFLKAEAYMQDENWTALELWLENPIEESFQHLRSALLAKVNFEQGDLEYKKHWNLAVQSAEGDTSALRALSNMALRWKWNDEAVSILWEIANSDRSPETGLYPLVQLYLGTMRDVKELRPVLERLLELYPEDQVVANDLASIDLFFEENLERAHSTADRLYDIDPERIPFKALKGFSLFRKGEHAQALELFNQIPAASIEQQPSLGLIMAQIEYANGMKLEALARLGKIPSDRLDHYEKEMLNNLRSQWLKL